MTGCLPRPEDMSAHPQTASAAAHECDPAYAMAVAKLYGGHSRDGHRPTRQAH